MLHQGYCGGRHFHPRATTRKAQSAAHALDAPFDREHCVELADTALRLARAAGASYADMRVGRNQSESLFAREMKLQNASYAAETGFGVRVLMNGSWGFAGSNLLSEAEIARMVALAVEMAQANALIQTQPIVIEALPEVHETWVMPVKTDPFGIATDVKAATLLSVADAVLSNGADFCFSVLHFVREEKFFASTGGSTIFQSRHRCMPYFRATAVDKTAGKFATRESLPPPRAGGWEYVESCGLVEDAVRAGAEVREKLGAKPVEPGIYDVVIAPDNLFLTIHETVGHSTELDRALGWEADFAGTSFVTPDKLGTLQFGSPLMTVLADRTQDGGLATIAFDDDGVRTSGAEFPIIENGIFKNYQMALGQAQYIGREKSNGCAYCDSPMAFPIQRMPNISLQPNPQATSLEDLFGGIERGVYIVGAGSWSIDQQRDNFQFSGQLFYEINNGKLGPMLRDVAYQGRTVQFWNSLDGLGDASTYFLGGTFSCGKGQPIQGAPVSHGAVPGRFRGVTVLNTERQDV